MEHMTLEEYHKLMGTTYNVQNSTEINSKVKNESASIQPKKSKYNSKKTKVDGIVFDSQFEADYYSNLKIRQRIGDIAGFALQPKFVLTDGEGTVITYKADFIVFYKDGGNMVVECKGFETKDWILRQKLFMKVFPEIYLKIIKKGDAR